MTHKIQTPLLRIFGQFYGLLGVQVTPIRPYKVQSLLVFTWNVTFSLAAFIATATMDLFNTEFAVTSCSSTHKPLFSFFMRNGQKLQAYLQLSTSAYFLFYGRALVRALDSPHFRTIYHSKRRAQIIFWSFFALIHLFLLLALCEIAQVQHWVFPSRWHQFARYAGFYTLFAYSFWLYNLQHYVQYGTVRYLGQLEAHLLGRVHSARRTLTQIKLLARTSQRINALLSLPSASFLTVAVMTLVLFASTTLTCTPRLSLGIHSAGSCLYALYLVVLNRRSISTVHRIFSHISQQYERKEGQLLCTLKPTTCTAKYVQLKRTFYSHRVCMRCHFQSKLAAIQSRRINLKETEQLFTADFSIRIFQVFTFNRRFLWQAILFILAYVVFFTQTTDQVPILS